ncbi:MAG: TIM barrel protein [Schlesneria sp.]
MTPPLTRRAFCRSVAYGVASTAVSNGVAQAPKDPPEGLTLAIGNYGMQSYKVEEAIRLISDLKYDALELTVMPEWDSSPHKLTGERRGVVRKILGETGLILASLMENLSPSAADVEHQKTLDRLKLAAELGHDLAPDSPPLIQTVLGGGDWSQKKELYRDRLGDWRRIAESTKTIIAVKPHRSGAMSNPEQGAWLLEQLGSSPWMGMIYDYSHYAMRGLSIAETINTAFPTTVQIVVKDVAKNGDQFEFALPGEANTFDHGEILAAFYKLGYRRSVCCEVSSQVFRRPGYDAAAAAKVCYDFMSRVFKNAAVPRWK